MKRKEFKPDRVLSYFKAEWPVLLIVAISGLIYNVGLLAGPYFEGQMTGCLIDILNGKAAFRDMLCLVLIYVVTIAVVQISRYAKRFYVRRFANNVNRRMKQILYGTLVRKSRAQLQEEGVGNVMTKAILDVDDCVEGMRKFTTEIFDTGVALLAYSCMLLWYDWRLALLCMIFPPVSYYLAEKMKVLIQRSGAAFKEQSGRLSTATLDRVSNAITYRVFGCEKERWSAYEENLTAYEKAAVKANIWNAVLPPVYRVTAMTGVLFILYFGGRNVSGIGWTTFDIAMFTTFLSCFTRLSTKASGAAKLFNAVHKAQVSWKRICPLLKMPEESRAQEPAQIRQMQVEHLRFAYPQAKEIIHDLSFTAHAGEIIGITGPVACGKSTLGKVFLCEYPYEGSIRFDDVELADMEPSKRAAIVGYLGHDPELMNDTLENNILMGDVGDAGEYLRQVCLKEEADAMEDGLQTKIGSSGVRLSGGQAQRLSLARTLCHKRPLLILDDPFSALDRKTEQEIFKNLQKETENGIVLLISHRLYLFPKLSKVIWMEQGNTVVAPHEELLKVVPEYRSLFEDQEGAKDEV